MYLLKPSEPCAVNIKVLVIHTTYEVIIVRLRSATLDCPEPLKKTITTKHRKAAVGQSNGKYKFMRLTEHQRSPQEVL